jgi:Carboxypeptidase regulatory-like domain
VQLNLTGAGGMTAQQGQSILNAVSRGNANVPPELLQNAQDAVRGGLTASTGVSDSAGQFTFKSVPVGTSTLRAQLEGYFGPASNGGYPAVVTMPVSVTADQVSNVKVALLPGGTITGKVFDPAGKPLSDSMVQLVRAAYDNGVPSFQVVNIKSTDDRGEYRLYRVAPGEYYVAADPRRRSLLAAATGGAGGNAGASAREAPIVTFYPNVADPDGASRVTVRSGDEISGINIQARTGLGYKVSGRVTSTLPPEPVTAPNGNIRPAQAVVSLIARDKRGLMDIGPSGGTVSANAEGVFEFQNVTPGSYDLVARLPAAANTGWGSANPPSLAPAPWAFGRASVDVRGINVENVAVVVRYGIDLTGHVILDGKPGAIPVRISVQPNGSLDSADEQTALTAIQIAQFQAPIAEDGSFTIPVLPEGRYRFQVVLGAMPVATGRGARRGPGAPAPPALPPLSTTAYLADIRQGGTSVYDNGIVVGTERTIPVEVLVNSVGGSVEGTVIGADQKPAANKAVVLIPPENRRQNPALYKTARTDAQGHFNLANLPPGRYTLFSWESTPPGAYQNAEFLSRYAGRGVTVIIEAGTHATEAVNLIRDEDSRR